MRKRVHAVVLYPSTYRNVLAAKKLGATTTAFPQLGLDAAREMIVNLAAVFKVLGYAMVGNYKIGYTLVNPDNDKRYTLEITQEWKEENNGTD